MGRERRIRRRNRTKKEILDVSLTPLIDTALTLLIIFMITTPMIHNAIRVDLPHGKAKEGDNRDTQMIVVIDKDNNVFFNNTKFSHDDLITLLKNTIKQTPDKVVFIEADQGVQYGSVIELVDKIKTISEVKAVALATKNYAT